MKYLMWEEAGDLATETVVSSWKSLYFVCIDGVGEVKYKAVLSSNVW